MATAPNMPEASPHVATQGGSGTETNGHTGFNKFSFLAGWDADLIVLGSTQATNVNNGMLDFSQLNANLTATVDATGALRYGSVTVTRAIVLRFSFAFRCNDWPLSLVLCKLLDYLLSSELANPDLGLFSR